MKNTNNNPKLIFFMAPPRGIVPRADDQSRTNRCGKRKQGR
jgi:hypothetical protein